MNNQYVVIMAGGIGTRFWPMSRVGKPKQFQDILGQGKTFLQMTFERFENICPKENIFVVTNTEYFELVKEQLQIDEQQILCEPQMRNTAPCIAYACYKIYAKNPDACIVVAPADHLIKRQREFEQVLLIALQASQDAEKLITLGISPTRPDTGYGYIQLDESSPDRVKKVKSFTEKPNLEVALKFLESGDFVWNAGIFIWHVKAILAAFRKYMPDLAHLFEEMKDFYMPTERQAIATIYAQCHSISIDYGIMEKAQNVYVIRCDLAWSDLGTWKSLYEELPKNARMNVSNSKKCLEYETYNTLIKVPENKLVIVQGLENYIVVEQDNVLLICQKDQEQRIKEFLENAKRQVQGDFF